MTILGKRATPTEIGTLVELMREFYAEANHPLDSKWASEAFGMLLGNPELGAVWLLLDGSQTAGYVVLTTRFSMEYGALDAFIDDLFVRPTYRRRGLARRGIELLMEECAGRGVAALHVIVGDGNLAAKALYSEFGFRAPVDDRITLTTRVTNVTPS